VILTYYVEEVTEVRLLSLLAHAVQDASADAVRELLWPPSVDELSARSQANAEATWGGPAE
jgi:hypothetical protein